MSNQAAIALPASTLRSRGMGFAACALFGAFWAAQAISTLPTAYDDAGYAAIALISAALLGAAVQLFRRGHAPASADAAATAQRRRTARRFWMIFIAEVVAMNIAAWWLAGHHRQAFLMPVIAVIVGLHFYPLASLFAARRYRVTASAMTLAGIAGIALLAGGGRANLINGGVELACALTLWTTGFASWRSARSGV